MPAISNGLKATGVLVMAGMAAHAAPGQEVPSVVITEIMYNPASNEQPPAMTEWLEIYNDGDQAVDVSGWRLQDEDGRTEPIPDGTMLSAGQAIVLIPTGERCIDNFQAAWGADVVAVALNGWSDRQGLSGLANSPSEENEILTLRNPDDVVVDQVNYDDDSPWPDDRPGGASIYLLPGSIMAMLNDEGARWRRSEIDVRGARAATATDVFSGNDIGSPGTVVAEEP